ncbi:hypothetical protein MRX96_053045, partial [Rhipicephalus microplus]
ILPRFTWRLQWTAAFNGGSKCFLRGRLGIQNCVQMESSVKRPSSKSAESSEPCRTYSPQNCDPMSLNGEC